MTTKPIDSNEINDSNSQTTSVNAKPIPGVSDRVRAAVTDSVVMIILSVIASQVLNKFSGDMEVVRGILLVLIFGLYDPIFTSFSGGTLGHRMMGLRVKRQSDQSKNIPIHLGVIRYLIKLSLGTISLLVVSKKSRRHAIHDIAAKSVVVYA